jgi:hypothetical protein
MSRVEAFVVTTPKLRYLARRYRISEYLLSSINASDPKVIEQVAIANRLSIDREAYEAHAAASDRLAFFNRPDALRFDSKTLEDGTEIVRIIIRLKTASIIWDMPKEEYNKHNPEWWLEQFRNYVYVIANKVVYQRKDGKGKMVFWKAEKVRFVSVDSNPGEFKKLASIYAKRYDYPIAATLLTLLGYHPEITAEAEAFLLLLARLLPLVSPEPIHGVEFTVPGTGKTTVALVYELALGWHYFAEIPSLATLVGDARTGTALIARASGVWFDEFDAWTSDASKRAQMRELIEVLLTGMWQGRWQRAKGGVHSIVVENPIPIWHSGNIYGPEHPRNKILTIIRSITPDKATAYNDRIAVAVTASKEELANTIQEWTLTRKAGKVIYGKPSVIKGGVELLQQLVAEKGIEPDKAPFKGRKADSYRRVYRALSVLLSKSLDTIEFDREVVEKLARKYVEGIIIQ